jgi:hypothetical protein
MVVGGCAGWGVRQFDHLAACRAAFERDVAGRCFITTQPLQLSGRDEVFLRPFRMIGSEIGPEEGLPICPAGTKLVVDRLVLHGGKGLVTGGAMATVYARLDLPQYRGMDIDVESELNCLICGKGSLMDINNEITGYYSMFHANPAYLAPCE